MPRVRALEMTSEHDAVLAALVTAWTRPDAAVILHHRNRLPNL
jgi:hypothetical protein